MECYKCLGKIAVISKKYLNEIEFSKDGYGYFFNDYCLPCIHKFDPNKKIAKQIMPFTKLELEKIRKEIKWTSLRSLKYDQYPFEKIKIMIYMRYKSIDGGFERTKNVHIYPCSTTNKVIKSEGFKTFDELITALKKKGFKFPQEFILYDLRKPIIK